MAPNIRLVGSLIRYIGNQSRMPTTLGMYPLRSSSTNYTINLMTDLSHRIALLERQLNHLTCQQRQLHDLQRLLQMGETFKTLHRLLRGNKVKAVRLLTMLRERGIDEDTLQWTNDICQLRNMVAHPNPQDRPDMTDLDPEMVRVYNIIFQCLIDFQTDNSPNNSITMIIDKNKSKENKIE